LISHKKTQKPQKIREKFSHKKAQKAQKAEKEN